MPNLLDQIHSRPHAIWSPTLSLQKFESGMVFDSGEFLVRCSDGDLDTDGVDSPIIEHWDADHQSQTSYDPSGEVIDANLVPYVVLPLWVAKERGLVLGSLCTVMDADLNVAHAILADFGPRHKIGEGSIQLWRLLRQERVIDHRVVNRGVDGPIRCLFYPGSVLPNTSSCAEIQAHGVASLEHFIDG